MIEPNDRVVIMRVLIYDLQWAANPSLRLLLIKKNLGKKRLAKLQKIKKNMDVFFYFLYGPELLRIH